MTELWDRLEDETDKAFAAFNAYCRMGAGRSIRRLAKKYREENVGKTSVEIDGSWRIPTLEGWSAKYDWQSRVSAFDSYQEKQRLAKWERRQERIRERDYEQGERLRKLSDKILDESPKFVKHKRVVTDRNSDGTPKTVMNVVALDGNLMITALNAASKLQRQAAGLDDKVKHEVSGPDGKPIETTTQISLEHLTLEQLESLAKSLKD